MAEEKDKPKCARETCGCPPTTDSKYCCEDCEDIVRLRVMEISCSCHHPECG